MDENEAKQFVELLMQKPNKPHPMSEQWMQWRPIREAPTHGKQILVGFQGQYEWYSYVAPAMGDLTGKFSQFARPTHWTDITPPADVA